MNEATSSVAVNIGDKDVQLYRRRELRVDVFRVLGRHVLDTGTGVMVAERGDFVVSYRDKTCAVPSGRFLKLFAVDGDLLPPLGAQFQATRRPLLHCAYQARVRVHIEKPQGVITVEPGDWVVIADDGERSACPRDDFDDLYEPASG